MKYFKLFENYINKDIYNITFEDVCISVDDYINNVINADYINKDKDDPYGNGALFSMVDFYNAEFNFVPYRNDISKDEDFFNYMKDENTWMNPINMFNNTKKIIIEKINNNKIHIWRVMNVDDTFLNNLNNNQHIGICWCFEESEASSLWEDSYGHKGDLFKIRIHGIVDIKDVDWNKTILYNMNLSTGDECEIRLKKNVDVEIVDMYKGVGYQTTDRFFPDLKREKDKVTHITKFNKMIFKT